MAASGDKEARKRLGRLLTLRRVEMDVRYRNRTLFAAERGINYRLVQDIENAARSNFDDAILAFISMAYGWTADSSARVLEGGDPVLADPGRDQAEKVGRAVLRVLEGGREGTEQAVPQAVRDWVRAVSGLGPRHDAANNGNGA